MCNYIGVKVSLQKYIKLKALEKEIGVIATLKTIQSGFEYSDWAIIKANDNRTDLHIELAHWELIPTWIKTATALHQARKQGIPWLNATAEKLLTSSMFVASATARRCLIPITHFFEWRHHRHIGGINKVTYPYCISGIAGQWLYLAGIYQPYIQQSTGLQKNSFAIITTQANQLMAQIHNTKKRMPTILPENEAYSWIMDDLSAQQIAEIASFQIPSNMLTAHTVSKNCRTEIDPTAYYEYENLPSLIL